jgi:hypothetical protein
MNSDRELDRLKAELPKSIEPPRDMWPQIADRISRGKVVAGEFGRPAAQPLWRRPAWLAAAAAVALVVTTSAVTTVVLRNRLPAGAAIPTPRGLVQDFASVETEYLSASSEILRAVHAGQVQLSPATIAVLEKNLLVIDDALRESREALARDPANSALREMVLASYRQKLDLLRRVTAGPVEL